MSADFTPGPWHALDIGEIVASDDDGYPDERILAYVNQAPNDEDHEANANLIAAAPELFEALAQCHAIFIGDDTETPIAKLVDAALAKARGES